MWFPPYASYCKLATNLGTAGSVAIDRQGRVYVAQSSGGTIERFSPPFPTGADAAGGCGAVDSTGAPVADAVNRLRSPERAIVVVTHYQRLLNYIVPDYVHVLADGKIVRSGGKELALQLEEKGYDWLRPEPAGAR